MGSWSLGTCWTGVEGISVIKSEPYIREVQGLGLRAHAYRYDEYHKLFKSIFRLPPSVPMHFVPGNHDLPLVPNKSFSPYARERYAKYFSPPNSVLPIANHSLILLDAVGLVEEDYRRYAAETQFGEWDGVPGGVIEFVKGLGDGESPYLVINRWVISLHYPQIHRLDPRS